jgi:spore maturation protein CgeB
LKIVVFGLSVTSSWGNGHATTYRALLSALHRRKHRIVFFEKDEEWYASNRDLPSPEFCEVRLFNNWNLVLPQLRREVADCDVAVLGSYFAEGIRAVDELAQSSVPIKAFYDIDTPITFKHLKAGGTSYLQPQQVPVFDLYLSFTGGPILDRLQSEFRAQRALPLYCSFEPANYYPRRVFRRYACDLSYMGTYAPDRQAKLNDMFVATADKLPESHFLLAGPQYPARTKWPSNVRHIRHLSPRWHPHFYSSSRLTLNLTRRDMVEWGYSPSVRLFEAAGCACPIVSDYWPGLNDVLEIGSEVLEADTGSDVISFLRDMDDAELTTIGKRARERVLAEHTADCRAEQFEKYVAEATHRDRGSSQAVAASGSPKAPTSSSGHETAQPI